MNNYNITAATETEKYYLLRLIRSTGATVTGVSGYGSGYYIQLNAEPLQVAAINLELARKGATA